MYQNDRSVGRYVSILYRQGQAYVSNKLKPYNIGSGQYPFLLALFRNDGISQEELSAQLMIDKGTTARAIEKLEKAGYVLRKTNPKDKRAYNVFLTEKAREFQPVLYNILKTWTGVLVSDLSREETDMLFVILKKMVNSTMLYMKQD